MARKAKPKFKKITTIEQIVEVCQGKDGTGFMGYFFIALGPNGAIKSCKQIMYDGEKNGIHQFSIFHGVDGSIDYYKGDEILTETNIGKAIENGCFFQDD